MRRGVCVCTDLRSRSDEGVCMSGRGRWARRRAAWPLSFVHIVRGTVQVGRYHLLQGDVIIRRRALLVGELGGGRCERGQLSGYCAHH